MLICKEGCKAGWFTPFRLGPNNGEVFGINAFSKSFQNLTNRLMTNVGPHAMTRVLVSEKIQMRQALALADKLTPVPVESHWHQLWFKTEDEAFHQQVLEHMHKNRGDLKLILHPPP